MNDAGWRRASELFDRLVDLPPEARAAELAAVARLDPAAAAEVAELLAAHDASAGFLDQPPRGLAAEVVAAAEDEEEHPVDEHLGAYRVVRRLGRGGTGTVYLGAREDQAFHRTVAIKVIRRGMATPDVVRRFRSERQILASIDHPGIAGLLDGGSTADGLPYLVMEYVDGEPIDRYCDSRRLPVEARLRLLRQVCAAVRVAHQNLVVHRDLKPANILVTREGEAKLLDFGIAKLLNPGLSGGEQAGPGELLLGTPEFASPEQLTGAPVTTASDVYSLGVLLYLLLSGHSPRPAARTATAKEMERDPMPPSAAAGLAVGDGAGEIARRRSTTPRRLARRLRDDLDAVALRALAWQPSGRYPSVEQLDEDLARALDGLPVRARPATLGYRSAKMLRRHRFAAGALAAALLSGAALVASHLVGERRVAVASAHATAEAAKVAAVNGFLRGILGAADPETGEGASLTVVEAVRAAVPRIGAAFAGQPEVEAAVRHDIGRTLLRLGQIDEAETQITASLRLRESLFGADSVAVAESLNSLGEARYDHGDLVSAGRDFERALEIRRRRLGADHPDVAETLDDIGNLHHDQDDLDGAESFYRQALAMRRRHDPLSGDVASSLNNLGVLLQDRGDLGGAEAMYRESLQIGRRALGEGHAAIGSTLNNLATLLEERGDHAAAEPLYRQAVAIAREREGARSQGLAVNLENLALLLQRRGAFAESEQAYLEALGVHRHAPESSWADVAAVLDALGTLDEDRERWASAAARYGEALELRRRKPDRDGPAIAWAACAEAHARARISWSAARRAALGAAFETLRATPGVDPEKLERMAGRIAALFAARGERAEAARYRSFALAAPAPAAEADTGTRSTRAGAAPREERTPPPEERPRKRSAMRRAPAAAHPGPAALSPPPADEPPRR